MALVAVAAYSFWLAMQVRSELNAARVAAERLTGAVESGDASARDAAAVDLRAVASDASAHTDGALWGAATWLPLVGDDAGGVRSLSRSLDTLASDGLPPLMTAMDLLDGIQRGGRIDLGTARALQPSVHQAEDALGRARDQVSGLDAGGYVAALETPFEEYVDRVSAAESALSAGSTAADVLPAMLGGQGPRDYLLVFQNNAEIRATGGLPGSWALLHADQGRLSLGRHGTAGAFPKLGRPVLPLTREERKVYFDQIGEYFQDANFTPDFPRAAELMRAHWDRRFPATGLDGIVALDPVALSYLFAGTGPVTVGGTQLSADNVVEELLNRPYLERDPEGQDALFGKVIGAFFASVTDGLESPADFVAGLGRAAEEDRLLVAPFVDQDAERLADSRVLGAMPADDGVTPYVDIGLNDATGSKMSYYLRYDVKVEATSCAAGVQQLRGSMRLRQTIPAERASTLPVSVTGGGFYGSEPGTQTLFVRLYGPHGGQLRDLRIDGRSFGRLDVVELDGRPVTYAAVSIRGRRPVEVTWSMSSGAGQVGDGELAVTPGVVAEAPAASVPSAC